MWVIYAKIIFVFIKSSLVCFVFHSTGNAGKRQSSENQRSEAIGRLVDKLLQRERNPIRKQAQLARLLERLGLLDSYLNSRDSSSGSWTRGLRIDSDSSFDDSLSPVDNYDWLQTAED